MEAPVIDAQQFLSTESDQTLPPSILAHAIAEAARDFGFCQLVNHGLSTELLDELEVCVWATPGQRCLSLYLQNVNSGVSRPCTSSQSAVVKLHTVARAHTVWHMVCTAGRHAALLRSPTGDQTEGILSWLRTPQQECLAVASFSPARFPSIACCGGGVRSTGCQQIKERPVAHNSPSCYRWPLQVKRTQDNPNGYFNDEFTKQALDLKEGFDCLYDDSIAGEANFVAPNQWPEGQVRMKQEDASPLSCEPDAIKCGGHGLLLLRWC